jgi:hypothetical protein
MSLTVLNLDEVQSGCPLCENSFEFLKGYRIDSYRKKMDKQAFYKLIFELIQRQNETLKHQGKSTIEITHRVLVTHFEEHQISAVRTVLDDISTTQRIQKLIVEKLGNKLDLAACRLWETLSKHKLSLLNRLEGQAEREPPENLPYAFT